MIKNNNWIRVLLLIIPYFIIVGIFQFAGILLTGVDFENIDAATIEQDTVISFFDLIGTFLLLWLFMRVVDNEPLVRLGFYLKNRKKDIAFGILIGLIIFSCGYFSLVALNEIQYVETKFNPVDVLLSVLVFSFVALSEEALFRGYILRNFMSSFSKINALLLSSLLFSLAHAANPNVSWFSLLDLFLAGVLLGISYTYTKNLWFPITLHFSWNFFQTLYGFNVSGQDFYSIIEFEMIEKNIINGGDFGFEGSILSTFIQVLLIAGIYLYYRKKNKNIALNSSHAQNYYQAT